MSTPVQTPRATPTDLVTVTVTRAHAAQMAQAFTEEARDAGSGGVAQALATALAAAYAAAVPVSEDAKWLRVAREELARVDDAVREGLTVWPKLMDRAELVRWCITRRIEIAGGDISRNLAPRPALDTAALEAADQRVIAVAMLTEAAALALTGPVPRVHR